MITSPLLRSPHLFLLMNGQERISAHSVNNTFFLLKWRFISDFFLVLLSFGIIKSLFDLFDSGLSQSIHLYMVLLFGLLLQHRKIIPWRMRLRQFFFDQLLLWHLLHDHLSCAWSWDSHDFLWTVMLWFYETLWNFLGWYFDFRWGTFVGQIILIVFRDALLVF